MLPANVELKILIVDDDPDIVSAMVIYLMDKMPKSVIMTCHDGISALEMWKEGKPELVILDMMLPRKNGFLVLEEIKKESCFKKDKGTIVIMITANQGLRHKIYAETIGVSDYLRKPFGMTDLAESICKSVEARRQPP